MGKRGRKYLQFLWHVRNLYDSGVGFDWNAELRRFSIDRNLPIYLRAIGVIDYEGRNRSKSKWVGRNPDEEMVKEVRLQATKYFAERTQERIIRQSGETLAPNPEEGKAGEQYVPQPLPGQSPPEASLAVQVGRLVGEVRIISRRLDELTRAVSTQGDRLKVGAALLDEKYNGLMAKFNGRSLEQ